MIISIEAEKAFDKIQHSFIIKNSPESGYRGNLPKHNKGSIWQPTAKFTTEKLETFPLRPATRQKHPFSHLFKIVLEILATEVRRKRNKGNPHLKRRIKLSLFEDDIIPSTEYLNNATRKLLDVINELGNVSACKISSQKFLAFLYTNKWSERAINETIPFTITSERTRYLGINLLKETKTCTLKTVRCWWKKLKIHRQMERYLFLE